jgi:hypothetical protein
MMLWQQMAVTAAVQNTPRSIGACSNLPVKLPSRHMLR